MGLKHQTIFNVLLSVGCGLSLLMTPARVIAQEYSLDGASDPQCCEAPVHHQCCEAPINQCCEEESCSMLGSRTSGVIFAGALLAGAIAIATTNNHNDGSTGPRGASGSDPFVSNSTDELTFTFSDFELDITSLNEPTSVTITPFVFAPDGKFFPGTPQTTTFDEINNVVTNLGSIVVSDPIFGVYQAGIQLLNNGVDTIEFYSEFIVVEVTTASNRPETITDRTDYPATTSANLIGPGEEIQIITQYGYAESIVP